MTLRDSSTLLRRIDGTRRRSLRGLFRKFRRPGENHLGIDIGSYSLKVVELRTTAGVTEVLHCHVEPIPPVSRDTPALAVQLHRMLQEHGIKNTQAVVGVGGPDVAARRVTLPAIPEEDIPGAIRWQARELFPFPMDDAAVAFQVVSRSGDEGEEKLDLLAVAATREAVMAKVAVLREAGLDCKGVVAETSALEQFWSAADLAKEEAGSQVLVDLGATKIGIHVFQDGILQFSRDVSTAGNSLTEALTGVRLAIDQRVAVDFTRAEIILHEYGIPSASDPRVTEEGIPLSQLAVRMRPALEKLVTEISRSLDYYSYQFGGAPVSRLFLVGGGSRLQGIAQYFSEWFDMETEFLDPMAALLVEDTAGSEEEEASSPFTLAVALGLALPLNSRLNLLPQELQERGPWKPPIRFAYVALGILFLVPAVQYVAQIEERIDAFREAAALRVRQYEGYRNMLEEYERMQELNRQLDLRLAALPALDPYAPPLAAAMKVISQKIPEKLALTRIEFRGEDEKGSAQLWLQGLIFGPEEDVFPLLSDFLEQLEQSSVFQQVQMGRVEREDIPRPATIGFELLCSIR